MKVSFASCEKYCCPWLGLGLSYCLRFLPSLAILGFWDSKESCSEKTDTLKPCNVALQCCPVLTAELKEFWVFHSPALDPGVGSLLWMCCKELSRKLLLKQIPQIPAHGHQNALLWGIVLPQQGPFPSVSVSREEFDCKLLQDSTFVPLP